MTNDKKKYEIRQRHYRTLLKGEYVSFSIITGPNGPQAMDVTGVCGGTLMCDVMPVRRKGGPPGGLQ